MSRAFREHHPEVESEMLASQRQWVENMRAQAGIE